MDTITAVIVTAFLNLAISTGVFLRVQKNIELSFAKQLEAFKTELQKDVIEHQVKFSRSYPKTMEVLETFTEQFKHYVSVFQKHCRPSYYSKEEIAELTEEVLWNRHKEYWSLQMDFQSFFGNNRHYLPDAIVSKIEKILEKSAELDALLAVEGLLESVFILDVKKGKASIENLRAHNSREKVKNNYKTFSSEVETLLQQVETIYKSAAEAR